MATSIPSTQQNIEIADIKDGVIFLNDGGYRIILSCAAINLGTLGGRFSQEHTFTLLNDTNHNLTPLRSLSYEGQADLFHG
jgi:hypothetical protein